MRTRLRAFSPYFRQRLGGAWALHELSLGWDLDFFVLFSSTVSVFGNVGQGNYAAANYYLNCLATKRRAMGLPAVSICWGPWEDTKMTEGLLQNFAQFGIKPYKAWRALNLMEQIASASNLAPVVLAIDLEPEVLTPRCPDWLQSLLPESWLGKSGNNKVGVVGNKLIHNDLQDIPDLLRRLTREVLKLKPEDPVPMQRPYFEIGFDSLMLHTLKVRLQQETGIEVPISHFFQFPSLDALGSSLAGQQDPVEAEVVEAVAALTGPDMVLIEEVGQLTDEQIAQLLNNY